MLSRKKNEKTHAVKWSIFRNMESNESKYRLCGENSISNVLFYVKQRFKKLENDESECLGRHIM